MPVRQCMGTCISQGASPWHRDSARAGWMWALHPYAPAHTCRHTRVRAQRDQGFIVPHAAPGMAKGSGAVRPRCKEGDVSISAASDSRKQWCQCHPEPQPALQTRSSGTGSRAAVNSESLSLLALAGSVIIVIVLTAKPTATTTTAACRSCIIAGITTIIYSLGNCRPKGREHSRQGTPPVPTLVQ